MEKFLFFRIAILAVLLPFAANAQEYAVFKTSGTPNLVAGTSTTPISKGSILTTGSVSLAQQDAIVMLNNKGDVFEINAPGNYTVAAIANHKKTAEEENFSSQYFSYVWRQMSSKSATKTHTGNIYRDAFLNVLILPVDSASVYKNEVVFTWEKLKNTDQYYFFLKNKETKTVSKMKVNGNSLTLYPGSNLLQKGNTYYWGIATIEYPDFTKIKMNQLNYLNEEQFKSKKEEFAKIIESLKAMGFKNAEIEAQMCQYRKLCFY